MELCLESGALIEHILSGSKFECSRLRSNGKLLLFLWSRDLHRSPTTFLLRLITYDPNCL